MTKQNKFALNSNLNFIQLKLFDFSEEKIDYEKIISERLNKSPNIENTNQKLFLDENNIFSYVNPICPVCGAYKIIKKGTITKNKQNINGKTTEFKESAGSYANLNSMAISYKSLTTLKSDIFTNNRKVEPVELIKSYYGVDNIDILGTAVCDGGSEIGDKTYIGMDYINPGMKLLYSRTTGTTVAPLGPDGEMYDFYPLIEFMRKDIRDELPMYTKLFILSSVGVLMNAPNRIIKGNFRA